MAAPNAPKLSDRLREPAPTGTEKEQAGGVTGAAPAAVELPQTSTPGGEAVRCSALLGAGCSPVDQSHPSNFFDCAANIADANGAEVEMIQLHEIAMGNREVWVCDEKAIGG